MADLRIVMAQIDTLVGDVDGNSDKIIAAAERAREEFAADAILFPELALCGYPPEDLLLRPGLSLRVVHGLERIKRSVAGIDIIVGYPRRATGGLYNAASLLRDGR
ncbi:MAG TPA: NAD+ synthase, partial [Gammaproteobacteria bacterium]|nr:NAD+ synthase [Gammaproteobacteria bacterium]